VTESGTRTTDLDALIARFFAVFDNRNGRVPKRAEFDDLFVPNAVILQRANGKTAVMSVSEFADPRVALLNSGRLRDFSEWETDSTTQVFSTFATRTSQYAKSGTLDSSPYGGTGTKLFQLANLQGEWRIVSLCWYDGDS
jgi:hypothetical protein